MQSCSAFQANVLKRRIFARGCRRWLFCQHGYRDGSREGDGIDALYIFHSSNYVLWLKVWVISLYDQSGIIGIILISRCTDGLDEQIKFDPSGFSCRWQGARSTHRLDILSV